MAAESLEVQSLRALAAHIGARVTDTTTPHVHAATSYHYAAGTGGTGLAIDLAEPSGPSSLTPGLARIASEVARLIGPQCQELIYAGGPTLRNGQPYRYGSDILAAHRNHVHVAVARGFRFAAPVKEVRPMFDPPLSLEPIAASLKAPGGGVWLLSSSGAVYGIEGAPYFGGVNGKDYFAGRKAARLLASDSPELPAGWNPGVRPAGKYVIQATDGLLYGPEF